MTFKIDPPISCKCCNRISEGEIFYGRTPYLIYCNECRLDLNQVMPNGIGYQLGEKQAIESFRDYCKAHDDLQYRNEQRGREYAEIDDKQIREQMYRNCKDWGTNP